MIVTFYVLAVWGTLHRLLWE